jgi:hypothetical protein
MVLNKRDTIGFGSDALKFRFHRFIFLFFSPSSSILYPIVALYNARGTGFEDRADQSQEL